MLWILHLAYIWTYILFACNDIYGSQASTITCGYDECNPTLEFCDHVAGDCLHCSTLCDGTTTYESCKDVCPAYYSAHVATTTAPTLTSPPTTDQTTTLPPQAACVSRVWLWISAALNVILIVTVILLCVKLCTRHRRGNHEVSRSDHSITIVNP